MKIVKKKASELYRKICTKAYVGMTENKYLANYMLLFLGIVLLTAGMTEMSHAQDKLAEASGILLGLIEGSLGALVMIVAGIAAIVSAAMGAYRAAVALLVVAVGAFILRTLVGLFFDEGVDFVAPAN